MLDTKLIYNLNKIVFKWSLIYFLTLIFLEDLKNFFVSSHFMPHILLPVIAISGLVLFFISHEEKQISKTQDCLEFKDYIIISALALFAGGLVVSKIGGLSFLGIILGVIVAGLVFVASQKLFKSLQ